MKISLHKYILLMVLSLITFTVKAQTDTTFIREVSLEKDYSPSAKTVTKIDIKPYIYEPQIQQNYSDFINSVPQLAVQTNRLGITQPNNVSIPIEKDSKHGYLTADGGNYGSFNGTVGYNFLNTTKDRLSATGSYNTMDGKIRYVQTNYAQKKANAKYADGFGSINYTHLFYSATLGLDASFVNTRYNYYGNTFMPSSAMQANLDQKSCQNINAFRIGGNIKGEGDYIHYQGDVHYNRFSSKYGAIPSEKGPIGGLLDLNINLYKSYFPHSFLGIKGGITNQAFGKKITTIDNDAYHAFTNIDVTPYYTFANGGFDLNAGLNINGLLDITDQVIFTPDVKLSYNFNSNTIYASVTGGINNNTYLDILEENRYFNPISRIAYSKTLYDAQVGFKSGAIKNLEFGIFGGYKYVDKDHLYCFEEGLISEQGGGWGNLSSPIYANISTGNIGVYLKTTLLPYTDLSLKLNGYFYKVKYTNSNFFSENNMNGAPAKAWGRPDYTTEINADIKPTNKIICSLSYYLAGGRKSYLRNPFTGYNGVMSMSNINELNLRGEYRFTKWFSVYAKLNNVLCARYELVYGYAIQNFGVLGGVSFKF